MFKFTNAQFVFFPKNFRISKNKSDFLPKLSKYFDGEQMILPIPDEAPDEIPRITMASKDESLKITISKNRIDTFLDKKEENNQKSDQQIFEDFQNLIINIFNTTKDYYDTVRIGLIIRSIEDNSYSFTKTSKLLDDSFEKLISAYGSNSPDLQIYFSVKNSEESGLGPNLFNGIKIGSATKSDDGKKYILLEFDMNNKEDLDDKVDSKKIESFLDVVKTKNDSFVKSILEIWKE
jgi:hypothetical protein